MDLCRITFITSVPPLLSSRRRCSRGRWKVEELCAARGDSGFADGSCYIRGRSCWTWCINSSTSHSLCTALWQLQCASEASLYDSYTTPHFEVTIISYTYTHNIVIICVCIHFNRSIIVLCWMCRYGPLVRHWTMRYEAKHNHLKKLAQNIVISSILHGYWPLVTSTGSVTSGRKVM